jgi:hypothetical protein
VVHDPTTVRDRWPVPGEGWRVRLRTLRGDVAATGLWIDAPAPGAPAGRPPANERMSGRSATLRISRTAEGGIREARSARERVIATSVREGQGRRGHGCLL